MTADAEHHAKKICTTNVVTESELSKLAAQNGWILNNTLCRFLEDAEESVPKNLEAPRAAQVGSADGPSTIGSDRSTG